MTIFEITKYNIKDLPKIEPYDDEILYDSIVIVPTGEIHDSGYMCMAYVFSTNGEVVGVVNRGSDVLCLDWGSYIDPTPQESTKRGWTIDCTPNGFLRLFNVDNRIKNMGGCGTYSVYRAKKT